MNILVIAPHHDDEVLGCGGTIAEHHKEGDRIWAVYITAGWSGVPRIKSRRKAVGIREKEARNACKVLGIQGAIFMREEDRNITKEGEAIQKLTKIIREIKPSLIYSPHPGERDEEHKITHKIVKEASWLSRSPYLLNLGSPTKSIKAIHLYEVWTPMEDFFIKQDITSVVGVKIKALLAYRSQMEYFNLPDAIIGLNMYRGSMVSTTKRFAEVFQVEKP